MLREHFVAMLDYSNWIGVALYAYSAEKGSDNKKSVELFFKNFIKVCISPSAK